MLPPLIVPETNILMDLWLGRDQDISNLLIPLAESKNIDLIVSEYTLLEFQGTALVWLQTSQRQNSEIRERLRDWRRTKLLGDTADDIVQNLKEIETLLQGSQESEIEKTIAQIRAVARQIPKFTTAIQLEGDKRFLAGRPPDKPRKGLKDCYIYEALLEIARGDQANTRPFKVFATKDTDFDAPQLVNELRSFNFEIKSRMGELLGDLL